MSEVTAFLDDLEGGRIEWPPERIAQAAAIEKRLREHPVSDEDAVEAAVAFITFTPLGGE